MTNAFRLYLRYVAASVRSQMQYRASFLMMSFGQFLVVGAEFLGVWALFDRFGGIKGWSLAEVALLYGMIHISFSLAEAFGRGFDVFGALMIRSGNFDRVLLRPRSSAFQIVCQELHLRFGRMLQAIVVFAWAIAVLPIDWTVFRIVLLAAAIISGACLFAGFFVLQATFAFWSIEGLELTNAFTYGGVYAAQFPLSIYRPGLRNLFTFVFPLACVNYLPLHALLGRSDPLGFSFWAYWGAPLSGFAFLLVALGLWKMGVRHYCSTGS